MNPFPHTMTVEKVSDGSRFTMNVMCKSKSGIEALRELQEFFNSPGYRVVSVDGPAGDGHPFTTAGAYGTLVRS